MRDLNIKIQVNPELYLKNPDSTELGRNIILNSIVLIDTLGFETFTFKKLSIEINSPESSIYRYFINKHTLLVYLTSWYWSWIDYRIFLATLNVESAIEKLAKSINILTEPVLEDDSISYVNEVLLNKIIIKESIKAYHTKDVDEENKKGCFESYKNVVTRVAETVLEINPKFEFSHMLVSTIAEGAHQQRYFSNHLPMLTDVKKGEDVISKFYNRLVFKTISP
ncbi:MAG: TetR/AcrR family transcriptional regulator [Flavobacteriales bacterium]|nr:TetR/AcrR family transcriptional regulator [Flavobacteriales bacterium]